MKLSHRKSALRILIIGILFILVFLSGFFANTIIDTLSMGWAYIIEEAAGTTINIFLISFLLVIYTIVIQRHIETYSSRYDAHILDKVDHLHRIMDRRFEIFSDRLDDTSRQRLFKTDILPVRTLDIRTPLKTSRGVEAGTLFAQYIHLPDIGIDVADMLDQLIDAPVPGMLVEGSRFHEVTLHRLNQGDNALQWLIQPANEPVYRAIGKALNGGQAAVYFGSLTPLMKDQVEKLSSAAVGVIFKSSDQSLRITLLRAGAGVIVLGVAYGVASGIASGLEHVTDDAIKRVYRWVVSEDAMRLTSPDETIPLGISGTRPDE